MTPKLSGQTAAVLFCNTERLSPNFKKQTPAVKTTDMTYSWQFRAQCYCVVSKLRLNTTSFLTVQCSRVSVVRPGTYNPCLVRVILILAGEYRHDCTTQSNRTDFFPVCRYGHWTLRPITISVHVNFGP